MHAREHRKGIGLTFLNRDVAADDNVRESGDVVRGLELGRTLASHGTSHPWLVKNLSRGDARPPTLETAQPEVGSSGWKSTERRVVSDAPSTAHENPEDRVPNLVFSQLKEYLISLNYYKDIYP